MTREEQLMRQTYTHAIQALLEKFHSEGWLTTNLTMKQFMYALKDVLSEYQKDKRTYREFLESYQSDDDRRLPSLMDIAMAEAWNRIL